MTGNNNISPGQQWRMDVSATLAGLEAKSDSTLERLENIEKDVKDLNKCASETSKQLAEIRIKSGLWGAIASVAVTIPIIIGFLYFLSR